MKGTTIVRGKVLKCPLPASVAAAWKANAGKTMTDQEAIDFVEAKRREMALRKAKPYLDHAVS